MKSIYTYFSCFTLSFYTVVRLSFVALSVITCGGHPPLRFTESKGFLVIH